MPAANLMPAFLRAFRVNELGSASPYQLIFAAKGSAGASFGAMQGDLAAGQANVTKTFHDCLAAAGVSDDKIVTLTAKLSVHLLGNPLSAADTKLVNNALLASKNLVDAMDQQILKGVMKDVDKCISKASGAGRSIEPEALLYIGLWINMSGPPTKLLKWLQGDDPQLPNPIPPAGDGVDVPAIQTYLQATSYYISNPGNWPHMVESVDAGAPLLP